MSIPGEAKGKYTHEVKFCRSKCGVWKVVGLLLVLFVVGMLIAIMCNIRSIRRHQDHIYREIDTLRWRLEQTNKGFFPHNHDNGPDSHPEEPTLLGANARSNHHHHHHPQGHYHHHHPHPHNKCRPQASSSEASLNDIKSTMRAQFSKLESRLQELSKSINSKQQFSEKILRQLRDFQEYMRTLLEPLKKIQNWF